MLRKRMTSNITLLDDRLPESDGVRGHDAINLTAHLPNPEQASLKNPMKAYMNLRLVLSAHTSTSSNGFCSLI